MEQVQQEPFAMQTGSREPALSTDVKYVSVLNMFCFWIRHESIGIFYCTISP